MTEVNTNEIDNEILPFLSLDAKPQVRCVAMQYFLGLTGSQEGKTFIVSSDKYLTAIANLLKDDQTAIQKDAFLAFVNICAEPMLCEKVISLETHPNFVKDMIGYVLKSDSTHADIACTILSNVSRSEECAQKIVDVMRSNKEVGFERLIFVFCKENYNPNNKLHYLGPLLSNLTQIRAARFAIMDHHHFVLQRLLPYLEYKRSLVRRGGIVGALRNCCFETNEHQWLLSPEVDILPRLLLPLAGPEEFDDDDMAKLPDDLQYLESDKERESDPDLRKMLCEAVNKLCARKVCRDMIKEKNAYVIFRELHKWEKDPGVIEAIESVVSVLIADEPEPGMEDLDKVEIPEDIETKLKELDEDVAKNVAEATEKMTITSDGDKK